MPNINKKTPKLSLLLFFVTGAVFLLQLHPYTGVFLMFLAGPFWSVITLNTAFVVLFFESITARCSRFFLIFPFIYFGGYLAMASASNMALHQLRTEISNSNSGIHVEFNSIKNDLIADESFIDLILNYNLPTLYTGSNRVSWSGYIANIVGDYATCAKGGDMAFFQSDPIYDSSKRWAPARQDICTFRYQNNPKKPLFRITYIEEENEKNWLLPIKKKVITIASPSSETYTLIGGHAAPYPWFPMPILGCALNSSAPSWECWTEFSRAGLQPLSKSSDNSMGDIAMVAEILGLKKVPIEEKNGASLSSKEIEEIKEEINAIRNKEAP